MRRVGDRVERAAVLEWAGETRRIVLSAPGWAEEFVEAELADALVLAALPWLETSPAAVCLRVRGAMSADLAKRLRRRRWLRVARGEATGGVVVRADAWSRMAGEGRRTRAALHYRGDVFSVAAALELAAGHRLYPRPELVVGADAEPPGGGRGREFLDGLGLRYAEVRIERPGPERAAGGAVDAAARLRFLGAGFGTGYVPATAAYRYAAPEAGEPDADMDPLFSGGGMRIVHVGAERALTGTVAALRRVAGTGGLPALADVESEARAPRALLAAGLALVGEGEVDASGLGALDFGRAEVRWAALDFLRWLRAEPELAVTAAGRVTGGALRTGLGLAEGVDLPKAEARRSPVATAERAPRTGGVAGWRPRGLEWARGLALISGNSGLVERDLEPLASWLRLREPGFAAGAALTAGLRRVARWLPWLAPRRAVDVHPAPEKIARFAQLRCGRGMPKSEEMAGLERVGVAVPRWRVLKPGDTVSEAEFGRYVVVKPDEGLRGACVRVQKASGVRGDPIHVEFGNTYSAPLVQEFIYTGPRPVSHRVGVLFGKAIYRWRVEGRKVEGRELPADGDFRARSGASVVSTGTGCEFSDPFDLEVIAFAERAAEAFPEIPLLGVDVARRLPDGKLFVLELNASGFCFHLTSDLGRKIQATTWLELPEQYGGFPYCADLHRLAWEAEHGW